MIFLVAVALLMFGNVFAALRSGKFGVLHYLAAMVVGVGFLLGLELLPPGGINMAWPNWSVLAFFIAGVASVLLFGVRLVRIAREPGSGSGRSWRYGLSLWIMLAGIYMIGTTVDHWWFFHDDQKAGFVDPNFLAGGVECSAPFMLVRIDGDVAEYRCPMTLALGRDYGSPFLPWPLYTHGSSAQLKRDLLAMKEKIEHDYPDQKKPVTK